MGKISIVSSGNMLFPAKAMHAAMPPATGGYGYGAHVSYSL